jgi:Flp pilus assembly protein TadD
MGSSPISRRHARSVLLRAIVGVALSLVAASRAPLHAAASEPGSSPADKERARGLLREGVDAMRAGDYTTAVAQFQQAYALVPNTKILFNLGVAYVALGRYPEALDSFERFVRDAPEAAPETLKRAEDEIRKARAKVATVELESDRKGAEVTVDGRSYGQTPVSKPIVLDTGPHTVVVRAGKQTAARDIVAEAGTRQKVRILLGLPRATPTPEPDEKSARPRRNQPTLISQPARDTHASDDQGVAHKAWFWALIGGVVAAAAVTGFLVLRKPKGPDCDLGYQCL